MSSGTLIAPRVPGMAERQDMQARSGAGIVQLSWQATATERKGNTHLSSGLQKLAFTYGKTWHTWQVDRGDAIPLGEAAARPLAPAAVLFCKQWWQAEGCTASSVAGMSWPAASLGMEVFQHQPSPSPLSPTPTPCPLLLLARPAAADDGGHQRR